MPHHADLDRQDSKLLDTPVGSRDTDLPELSDVWDQIEQAAGADPDIAQWRQATVSVLQATLKAERERIAALLSAAPRKAFRVHAEYAQLTDLIVRVTIRHATEIAHRNPTPTVAERLAVVAVGGYGRGEMAPFSDVDLLFLTPYKMTGWAESVIETTLYLLWDLHLKVGHSSRTVNDCIRLGKDDFTIRTALLEQRLIDGDKPLADELEARLRRELFRGTSKEFVDAKLAERAERHRKQGGQRYVVEPNVKEGKGGLRDLQSLYWIHKYVNGVREPEELVKRKVFTADEFDRLNSAEEFLMAVRCQLHLIAGRAMDQLTFDMQVEVADRLGYQDRAGRRAVEFFMQDYFRQATVVGELTRIFLTSLEAKHLKNEPLIVGLFRRRKSLKEGYKLVNNRLTFQRPANALKDRLNILRIFEEALRTGYLIHPDIMRFISSRLHLIDDELRNDPEAARIFLDILLKHGNPERGLRRMNELGVLGAFIPEFQPIVAMMQFNMYHSYTVDEHTIQCISNLAQIERRELVEELPVASGILEHGVNRRVLYVALLVHDLGKGRDEDHSVLGAKLARVIAPRLGLRPKECETVEWLVRYHLLMSDIAQKRDISDPRTVRDFAKAVRTRERLDLLTVLTVCDIRGVGPSTWNNWKAVLLRNLHNQTATALRDGLEALNTQAREDQAKRNLREALNDWPAKDLRTETARHYPPYWQGLPSDVHKIFARLLRDIGQDEIRIDLLPDDDRDATRACFALADHPGIFSRLAGALALVGANVVDARTYTSRDGFATAVFWIQDADGHPYETSRLQRLRNMIARILKGEIVAREALADRDKIKKRERPFRVPTNISFDNEGSEIYTIIEVDTRDRPGLLYDLTRTMAENNVYISSAVIATYGAQVVDTFYVKDMFGLKFHAESKCKTLERKLREAIEKGAERAREKT
jgi:[protein-PII] uridylyltransferase